MGREVGVAWQRQLEVVASSVQGLKEAKLARDQRVLLALLTNAARSTPQPKVLFTVCVFPTKIPLFCWKCRNTICRCISYWSPCSVYRRVSHC